MRKTALIGLVTMLLGAGCADESRAEAVERCQQMVPESQRVVVRQQDGGWICDITI